MAGQDGDAEGEVRVKFVEEWSNGHQIRQTFKIARTIWT
jgi:hypothetical protein